MKAEFIELRKIYDAINLLSKFNKMDFNEFATFYEEATHQKISKEIRDKWKFVGLNNIDFIRSDYLEKHDLDCIYDIFDYFCKQCEGVTRDADCCHNPSCPNQPCCNQPKEECNCNK